ncbi:MAG: class I SAM-dependent methyltransferase [Bacilli bacterium]|nr:class I SAM-dependent methyltransferase [Bacilli bacterium]MBR0193945.1 class I SAM-dependent methyltransferase [Bacilli bacterium]
MSHYFINDESLGSSPRQVRYVINDVAFSLSSDIGVFSKSELDWGSRVLIETLLPLSLGESLLDLGCGIGPIGLTLAYFHPRLNVTCSDVNTRALVLCEKNAQTLALSHRVTCLQSDIYIEIEGKFHSIVSNPPIRAGKKVTYRIYDEAKEHLEDGGSLYVVVRKAQGAESVKKHLEEVFGNVTILKKSKGYFVLMATKMN